MKTETLAAEAVLLAVKTVSSTATRRGFILTMGHVFSDGGPLFDVLIDYEAFEPFTEPIYPRVNKFNWFMKPIVQGSMFSVDASHSGIFTSNTNRSILPSAQAASQCAQHRSTHSGSLKTNSRSRHWARRAGL